MKVARGQRKPAVPLVKEMFTEPNVGLLDPSMLGFWETST